MRWNCRLGYVFEVTEHKLKDVVVTVKLVQGPSKLMVSPGHYDMRVNELTRLCRHCYMDRKDHSEQGHCLYGPTNFE